MVWELVPMTKQEFIAYVRHLEKVGSDPGETIEQRSRSINTLAAMVLAQQYIMGELG